MHNVAIWRQKQCRAYQCGPKSNALRRNLAGRQHDVGRQHYAGRQYYAGRQQYAGRKPYAGRPPTPIGKYRVVGNDFSHHPRQS